MSGLQSRWRSINLVQQGASLCATVILKHQEEFLDSPSPFKFAIFINSWLPFSWTPELGQDVTNVLLSDNPLDTSVEAWQNTSLSCELKLEPLRQVAKHALFDINPEVELKWRATIDTVVGKDNDYLRPRCFHPELYDDRLELATAHLWGERDIFDPHSRKFFQLCDSDLARSHQHDGGHDFPQSWDDNERFSEIIQKTVLKSQFAM
ncbi:hypothetical protein N7456_007505 [Penicillium angulare]|uniref:Serine hydrolase domain-containing protein n=1 Tax=Penicillium angulare TaxID=116970 RepID=A0A9W9FB49_9EURO|nr:hypothetical protein N7456_007505 [Penicillium angulare]